MKTPISKEPSHNLPPETNFCRGLGGSSGVRCDFSRAFTDRLRGVERGDFFPPLLSADPTTKSFEINFRQNQTLEAKAELDYVGLKSRLSVMPRALRPPLRPPTNSLSTNQSTELTITAVKTGFRKTWWVGLTFVSFTKFDLPHTRKCSSLYRRDF